MPRITAVIVTWNSHEFLETCLSSLRGQAGGDEVEIVVVDNASSEKEYLRGLEQRHDIRVVCSVENLGYARAANLGLSKGTGEYCLVLNPDIVFTGNPFPRLIVELERDPGLGAVAPLLVDAGGRAQISGYYLKFPSVLQYLCTRTVVAKFAWVRTLAIRLFHSAVRGNRIQGVDQIPGAFLFFRRDLFADGHWMNEAFFLWMEDVDFCFRIARLGKRVAVVSDQTVRHAGASSFNQTTTAWRRRVFTQSYLKYVSMNAGPVSRAATRALMAVDTSYRIVSLIVRGLFTRNDGLSSELGMERELLSRILTGGSSERP